MPHQMGRGLNALAGRKPAVLKPGFRMAGGLTGAILGGALGAGAAALMKQDGAGKALAKVQTRGDSMTDMERAEVAKLLSELTANLRNSSDGTKRLSEIKSSFPPWIQLWLTNACG